MPINRISQCSTELLSLRLRPIPPGVPAKTNVQFRAIHTEQKVFVYNKKKWLLNSIHYTAVLKYPRSILSSISFELKQLDHDILCAVPDVQLQIFKPSRMTHAAMGFYRWNNPQFDKMRVD